MFCKFNVIPMYMEFKLLSRNQTRVLYHIHLGVTYTKLSHVHSIMSSNVVSIFYPIHCDYMKH